MLTRVRIEASAKTEQEVKDEVLAAATAIRESEGGEWTVSEDYQTTKNGWWGYISIGRKKEGTDGTEG